MSYLCYGSNSNDDSNIHQWSLSDTNSASHMVITVVSVMSNLSRVVYFNNSGDKIDGIDGSRKSHAFSSMTSFFLVACLIRVSPFHADEICEQCELNLSVHFHDLFSVLNLRDIRGVFQIKISCDSRVSCVSSNCLRFNLFPSSFL